MSLADPTADPTAAVPSDQAAEHGSDPGNAPRGGAGGRAGAAAAEAAEDGAPAGAPVPAVGARQPCPCGSGRRYKACHGARSVTETPPQSRPFGGHPSEPDLVCLREVVPAATAPLRVVDSPDRDVLLATVLPAGWAALVRADGRVMLGLQTPARSGDLDRDLGQALQAALAAAPGTGVSGLPVPGPGAGFGALTGAHPLDITVHDGFDFWIDGADADADPQARDALDKANAAVVPTHRLASVSAAYWCRIGSRTHLRWALPEPENALLDAFARLHARRALDLGDGSRYVGAFRAHGLLVPVWDLPEHTDAAAVEQPAVALRARLDEALAAEQPLTGDERRARAGVVSRQVTLR